MSVAATFAAAAAARYEAANVAGLDWMLERTGTRDLLDTKMNPLTARDYTGADGLRGPGWTYGWIQGRGLEALVTHAAHYEASAPELAARLDAVARRLYRRLAALQAEDGHVYFLYDATMTPVRTGEADVVAQVPAGPIFGYADVFAAKGLIAAAARLAPEDLPRHLGYLDRVVAAVTEGRFQIDERAALSPAALAAQPRDYGPRMILLGAAAMLERLGLGAHAAFAGGFLDTILVGHLDAATHLLRNVPGEDAANPGHAIECVGFALDIPAITGDPAVLGRLERILHASAGAGFGPQGIALSVSARDGRVLNPICPWWPLPEAIRAAALLHARRPDEAALALWRRADDAFFRLFWRGRPPVACQARGPDDPLDYVPATPDLDPGYHTGLGLLGAIRSTFPSPSSAS